MVEFVLKAVKFVGSETTNLSYLKIQLHPRFETAYAILACAWDTHVSFGACPFGTCFSSQWHWSGQFQVPNPGHSFKTKLISRSKLRFNNWFSYTHSSLLLAYPFIFCFYGHIPIPIFLPFFLKIFIALILYLRVRDGW